MKAAAPHDHHFRAPIKCRRHADPPPRSKPKIRRIILFSRFDMRRLERRGSPRFDSGGQAAKLNPKMYGPGVFFSEISAGSTGRPVGAWQLAGGTSPPEEQCPTEHLHSRQALADYCRCWPSFDFCGDRQRVARSPLCHDPADPGPGHDQWQVFARAKPQCCRPAACVSEFPAMICQGKFASGWHCNLRSAASRPSRRQDRARAAS